jgi:hypothetical protein
MKRLIIIFLICFFFNGFTQYVFYEDCEETGTPAGWTDSDASIDWDYIISPLDGRQSWYCNNATERNSLYNVTAANEYYGACMVKFGDGSPSTARVFWSYVAATAAQGTVRCHTDGRLRAYCGTVSAYSTTVIAANTTYYIWTHYKLGTGNNAIMQVYVSTTPTKPASPEINISTGTTTAQIDRIQIYANQAYYVYVEFDQIKVSTADISDFILTEFSSTYKKFDTFNAFKK